MRDSSGAIVPGATVTVTNVATNAVLALTSDENGFYRALNPEFGCRVRIPAYSGPVGNDVEARSEYTLFTYRPIAV